jgi:Uma2 family endonuclease
MAKIARTGLTYADLERTPDDGNRYELIDGELFVTPPPDVEHQWAVMVLAARLFNYAEQHGGRAQAAPTGVFFDQGSHVEPDVLYSRAEHLGRWEKDRRYVQGAPDLVVEVSSPTTRVRDLGRKRSLYERHGVEEYWFVDRDAQAVVVHRLVGRAYGPPERAGRGEVVTSTAAPGFRLRVDELFEPPRP